MRKSRSDGVATRAAILEAAADEFAEKGYELASARAVCARAGVNAALSSRYFGTKEDLYRTTAKSLFGDLGAPLAVLPEKMGSGDSPRVVISTPDSGDSPRLGSGDDWAVGTVPMWSSTKISSFPISRQPPPKETPPPHDLRRMRRGINYG